jgi:hypothetical protein
MLSYSESFQSLKYRVFQKELYNGIPNGSVASITKTFVLKCLQNIHRSTPGTMDSLYTFKCKMFRNNSHTVIFGIPLYSSFWNALHYQWKSHWTVAIPVKTRCVLLHCDSSKHGTCPQANYTDRATAAYERNRCQLFRIGGATWSALRILTSVF